MLDKDKILDWITETDLRTGVFVGAMTIASMSVVFALIWLIISIITGVK